MCRWEDSGEGLPEQLSVSSKDLDGEVLSQEQAQLSRLGDGKASEPYFRGPKRVPSSLSR